MDHSGRTTWPIDRADLQASAEPFDGVDEPFTGQVDSDRGNRTWAMNGFRLTVSGEEHRLSVGVLITHRSGRAHSRVIKAMTKDGGYGVVPARLVMLFMLIGNLPLRRRRLVSVGSPA